MMMCWILVALFAAARAAPDCKNCMAVGKAERAMFRAHSEACLPRSRAPARQVEALLRGEPLDAPALRRHVYCVLLRCKLIGKDGKPLKSKLAARADARNATEVSESCASQPGDTPEDLAWNLFRCGYGKKAVLFHHKPTPSAGADNDAV